MGARARPELKLETWDENDDVSEENGVGSADLADFLQQSKSHSAGETPKMTLSLPLDLYAYVLTKGYVIKALTTYLGFLTTNPTLKLEVYA